jgi:hypothetical protein
MSVGPIPPGLSLLSGSPIPFFSSASYGAAPPLKGQTAQRADVEVDLDAVAGCLTDPNT